METVFTLIVTSPIGVGDDDFGVARTMRLAALPTLVQDAHSLGLEAIQDMELADRWGRNRSRSRAQGRRRGLQRFRRMPSSIQAADCSVTQSCLKAGQATGTDDGERVMGCRSNRKRTTWTRRAARWTGGRKAHDPLPMQVKRADAAKQPRDFRHHRHHEG